MAKQKKKKRKHLIKKSLLLFISLLFVANIFYAIYEKPGHILSPLSKTFVKNPYKTWLVYQEHFNRYASRDLSSNFLAALAQTESSGNPLATSYWRWRISEDFLRIFHPASSAIGLYQITTPTFQVLQNYCWQGDRAVYDKSSEDKCWMNLFRFRFSAHDSVYLVSAYLNYWVRQYQSTYRLSEDQQEMENLAATIHLCGKNKVARYLRSNRKVSEIRRCGSHRVRNYLSKIQRYKNKFTTLARR